jgi:hypothetical protein
VQYATQEVTALGDLDYTSKSGTLFFFAGDTEKTIVVSLSNDSSVESDEIFKVALAPATASGAIVGPQKFHTVTIKDDEASTVEFAALTSAVVENAGTISLVVNRTGNQGLTNTAQYATQAGSAQEGSDFTAASGTLTFNPGDTQKTIVVPIIDDGGAESDETFTVTLSNPTNGAVLGTLTTHTVTILGDVPFAPVRGSFVGLASDTAGLAYGAVAVQTTARGRVTGKLQIEGRTYSFSGPLDSSGQYFRSFLPKAGGLLARGDLQLSFTRDGKEFTGLFNRGDNTQFDLSGGITIPLEGSMSHRYNAVITGEIEGATLSGYMLLNFSRSGAAHLRGALPDGKPFIAGSHLVKEENLPVFIPAYAREAGHLAGPLQFANGPALPLTGELKWKKPPSSGVFPSGLVGSPFALAGAPYVRPQGGRVLDDFNATAGVGSLRFSGGGLGPNLVSALTIDLQNRPHFASGDAHHTRLTINARNGTFAGSFLHDDGHRCAFKGVLVQQPGSDSDIAEGCFSAGSAAGWVELLPGTVSP